MDFTFEYDSNIPLKKEKASMRYGKKIHSTCQPEYMFIPESHQHIKSSLRDQSALKGISKPLADRMQALPPYRFILINHQFHHPRL